MLLIRKYIVLLLGVSLIIVSESYGQQVLIQTLTSQQGLSQGMVNDMIQDKEGFIWIATRDGLNRYDGYHFKTYNHDKDNPNSISDNIITHLYEDSQGHIWIATDNQGLDCFDKKTETFHHFRFGYNPTKQANFTIRKIVETPDKHLWLELGKALCEMTVSNKDDKGISVNISPQLAKYQLYLARKDIPCAENETLRLYLPTKNKIGVRTATKLLEYDIYKHQWIDIPSPLKGEDDLSFMYDSTDNSFWAIQGENLIYWKDGNYLVNSPIPANYVHGLGKQQVYKGKDKDIWIIMSGYLFHITAEMIVSGKIAFEPFVVKTDNHLLIVDKQNRIWVGTSGYGVYTFHAGKPKFEHLLKGITSYFIASYSANILLVRDLEFVHFYTEEGKLLPNPYGQILTPWIFQSNDKTVYLPSEYKTDILAYPPNQITNPAIIASPCLTTELGHFVEDPLHNIWINCHKGKILSIFHGQDSITTYNYAFLFDIDYKNIFPTNLYYSSTGTIWIGTQYGLVEMQLSASKKATFKLYKSIAGNPKSLSQSHVLSLADDPKEPNLYLWIGTKGGGLNRLNKQTGEFIHYTTANGLPNNVIYGILTDDLGNLWLSTNQGLSCFNPTKNNFRNYTTEDGLQDNEFNSASYFKQTDGTMLFGGVNGVTRFHPHNLQPDTHFSPVFFTSLKLDNKLVNVQDSNSVLKSAIEFAKEIPLTYNQNFLTLSFAALDFQKIGNHTYRHKMEGVDRDWVYSNTQTEVSYPNLSPGTYTLRVSNSNEAGDWNPEEAQIIFIISPPWWRTNFAYLVYAIILGLALFYGIRFQLKRIQLQNELILKKKETLQLQALDETKNRFLANITHEFRTPLTLMLEPLRSLLNRKENTFQNPKLQMAISNSQHLLSLVNQMLDIAKLEDGNISLKLREGDIIPLLQSIYESFLPLAEEKNISLTLHTNQEAIHCHFDSNMIAQVANNLLSNALKFTDSLGKITFSVGKESDKNWYLSVKDSGLGISEEEQKHIFDRFYQVDDAATRKQGGTGIGLALVKEWIELAEGEIKVESAINKGTSFTIILPLYSKQVLSSPISKNEEIYNTYISEKTQSKITSELVHTTPNGSLVLLVEDNAEMREYLRIVLEENAYEVIEAENGQKGIEIALEKIPDIIISDVMMPIKDGFSLTETLKSNILTSHIPIILLTAKGTLESKITGYRIGADAYLAKPFYTEELLVRINQLLLLRQKLQEKYRVTANSLLEIDKDKADEIPTEEPISAMDNIFLSKIRTYIHTNIQEENLNIDTLITEFAMSRSQLHRKLTALTGISPARFVRETRLQQAYNLLKNNPDTRVGEVAFAVGFSDSKYFTQQFKAQFGLLPQDVRKMG